MILSTSRSFCNFLTVKGSCGCMVYIYQYNQYLTPLCCKVESHSWSGILEVVLYVNNFVIDLQ